MTEDMMKIAEDYYKNADYENALKCLLEIIKISKNNEKALVLAANSYDYCNDKKKAVSFYQKAIKVNPDSLVAHVNLSIIYYELKEYDMAEKYAQKVLKKDSKNNSALIILGNIFYGQRQYEKALDLYLYLSSYQKNNYISSINLANTYMELKKYHEAVKYAMEAQEIAPQKAVPYSVLGNAYRELEKDAEAILALEKAVEINPDDAWNYNYLSQIYQKLEKYNEALGFGYQAVLKNEELNNSHHINFGYLLYEISEKDMVSVQRFAQEWLDTFPQSEVVKYMANAILKEEKMHRANDEYLKNIFDVFAEDFETVLSSLNYKAPEYIAEELERFYGESPSKKMTILDAGCGTGLCGLFLKKYAKIFGLHGVDISQKMLDVAKRKKIYNRLFCQELVAFLKTKNNAYDLIVSSDVFTYFGELEELFYGLRNSLKKEGKLIFTISKNRINEDSFLLHTSGRFLHDQKYIKSVLKETGFEIDKFIEKVLRNEGDEEVSGYLISVKKMVQKSSV
ncbi:MAG: tetratricopeptide repeat protein [Alphaproteobacteria bacterium]